MQVFISWSGDRSRSAAAVLREWLETVMPNTLTPWMSDTDIDKGSRWANGIGVGLEEMRAGISVLTPENLAAPWLNFEAGAIGKAFGEARVMTLLIGLAPTEVKQPLAQFQATRRTQPEVLKMLKDLNALSEAPMKDSVLQRQVERWWPDLDDQLATIEAATPVPAAPRRGQEEMLEEILGLLRDLSRTAPGVGVGAPQSSSGMAEALARTAAFVKQARRDFERHGLRLGVDATIDPQFSGELAVSSHRGLPTALMERLVVRARELGLPLDVSSSVDPEQAALALLREQLGVRPVE